MNPTSKALSAYSCQETEPEKCRYQGTFTFGKKVRVKYLGTLGSKVTVFYPFFYSVNISYLTYQYMQSAYWHLVAR